MKRNLIALSFLILFIPLVAVIQETASLKHFLYGHEPNCAYDNWISHLAEGVVIQGYNTYAPYDRQTNGFGNFVIATTFQLSSWGNIVDLFLEGMLDEAQSAIDASGFPYQVVIFNDTDTNITYRMLREIPDSSYVDQNGTEDDYDDEIGAFAYGWGLYIYNPEGTRPIIVTAPHPCDDFPTPAFALESFKIMDAQFLLINGAGREVKWTNSGSYTNTKSLSDPTRVANHPFNTCYKKFVDKLRIVFNCREFSPQIHSYDWNYHAGYPNVQISAGNSRLCPNLPIRDLSSLKLDMINQGHHIMVPANTVGFHSEVELNDFYSVYYDTYPFIFDDGEHSYEVNNYIDLPAYSQNYQMLYSLENWTDYDVYDPFLHVEMDELPNSYELTENTYRWFYGWNEAQQRWNFDHLFDNFLQYYLRWVYDLNSVLNTMFAMNDGLNPPTPTGFAIHNQSLYSVTLQWNKVDCYDFDTFEILYSTDPIGTNNYQVYNRSNNAMLASPYCESITVPGLSSSSSYFFKIRTKDKNGNYSDLSNQITTIPAPANVYTFTAHGMDNAVRLYWGVSGQNNNQGFSVYRKNSTQTDYSLIDSYLTNSSLNNPTASSFTYWDYDVANGQDWEYIISCTNTSNQEFFYNYPATAAVRAIHSLYIRNNTATLADTISFAQNSFASDAQDAFYDVTKGSPSGSNYVWAAFWEQYWGNNGTTLSREVKGGYNTALDIKTWAIRIRSTELNTPLYISASNNFNRAEKLYLYDSYTGTWHNLFSGPYQFTVPNSNVRTMTLYWGNLQPKVVHSTQSNQLYQGGNNIPFQWSCQNNFLVDHLDLYIKNETDSLFLVANVPGNQTNFTYNVPQNLDMQSAHFYIDCHAVDGLMQTYRSSYTFAIVPRMVLHSNEAGWQTRSHIWPDLTPTVENIFGTGATAFIAGDNNTWVECDDFLFGIAYWVNAPDMNFFSSTADICASGIDSFPLEPGWNFVANPHYCRYPIHSLRFLVGNNLFLYSEMIAQHLISRAVYVYRNGRFQAVDVIEPFESFFIKYYCDQSLNTYLSFYPYFEAPEITPPDNFWQFQVAVTCPASDTDEFILGTNPIATDGYDFYVDLPAAPVKPFPSISAYLTREAPEDISFTDKKLSCEFREVFSPTVDQEKIWHFKFTCSSVEPIEFDLSDINLPNDYTIRIFLGENIYTYRQLTHFTYVPAEPGTYEGLIKVTNYPVSVTDLIQKPVSALAVYPNPFNPTTTIAFSTSQTQVVEVSLYNLKGQKVRTLHKGILKSGEHKLIWDGKDNTGRTVSSGVYFTRIETGKQSLTRKLLLMK